MEGGGARPGIRSQAASAGSRLGLGSPRPPSVAAGAAGAAGAAAGAGPAADSPRSHTADPWPPAHRRDPLRRRLPLPGRRLPVCPLSALFRASASFLLTTST